MKGKVVMKKELPEIFKNKIDTSRSNNKKVYYTSENEKKKNEKTVSDYNDNLLTVEDKIRKLFKSSRYIFNINVVIKTDKKDYDTRVAGKIKNSLVTVDNEVIPIVEINDIIIKDRI